MPPNVISLRVTATHQVTSIFQTRSFLPCDSMHTYGVAVAFLSSSSSCWSAAVCWTALRPVRRVLLCARSR